MENSIKFTCGKCGFEADMVIVVGENEDYELLEKNMIYIDHKQALMEISLNGNVDKIEYEDGVYRCQKCHNLENHFYYNMTKEDKYIAKYISSYKNAIYRGIPQRDYNPIYYCGRCSFIMQHLNMEDDYTFTDDSGKKTTIHCPNCYSTSIECEANS
ncbi:MAG: hypothetical protein ATN32_01450 [Candidatus Epulonipiscium fishelsonii]|nr:MAG: hypothetical protein ATN32_01450 [Epulopiscium sp. AS2M-Bin002]